MRKTNHEVSMILALRRVLESAGQGAGMARSIVLVLRGTDRLGKEAARLTLLGRPIAWSMKPMTEGGSEEVAMLASLIVAAPRSSAPTVGERGGAIASTVERWVKSKETRALELKVMRFRSLVTSGVLGAVTAMVGALGPLVSSFGIVARQTPDAGAVVYGAAAMAAISSGMLGVFMSGRKFYVNVAVTLLAFILVYAFASPLAEVPSFSLWGVK